MATGPQDIPMEEEHVQRRGRNGPFQIFPEPGDELAGYQGEQGGDQQKERLPSIVVETTGMSEEESGELRWPPQDQVYCEEDEDPFQDQCVPHANITNKAENEEDTSAEEGSLRFKYTKNATMGQLDYTRLTPPPSPTSPEVAPPSYRN